LPARQASVSEYQAIPALVTSPLPLRAVPCRRSPAGDRVLV